MDNIMLAFQLDNKSVHLIVKNNRVKWNILNENFDIMRRCYHYVMRCYVSTIIENIIIRYVSKTSMYPDYFLSNY